MESKAENKIIKARIDCGDGKVNEIEGEGIIAIALTKEDGGVNVQGNIEGMHSIKTLVSAIKYMQKVFGATWDRAEEIAFKQMIDEMIREVFDDKGQAEASTESQTRQPEQTRTA